MPGLAIAGPGSLKPYITTKDLYGNSKQYHPEELTDDRYTGWSQYLLDQVDGAQREENEDQVDQDSDQYVVSVIIRLQRHHGGKRAGTCDDREGDRHHIPRLAVVVMPEEIKTQYHLQPQYKYDYRTCYGKRMDIQPHEIEHLLAHEEECQYQSTGYQGSLGGANAAHLLFQSYDDRYGAQHIYHREEGEAERNYLRKV